MAQSIKVEAKDGPSVDAFGRWRVSNPVTLFDSQMQYDLGRLYWEEDLDNSATSAHDADAASVTLTVTADASDNAVRQTREYFRYQPGKSQLIFMTADFGAASSGVYKRYGYYDDDNGFYFEQTAAGGYQVVKRSSSTGSAVNTAIPQADWNIDRMDGKPNQGRNPSGHTLDGTKSQIFVINLQWLAVGRVIVALDIDGVLCPVHAFTHANKTSSSYMTTANLPCRYEIGTDGTNGGTFETICASVVSEGGFEVGRANPFSVANGATLISRNTRAPIISIRPKATFNSIVNRGLIVPTYFNAFSQDKQCFFEIVYGGTLTSASFASANDDSIAEFDVAASAISGGIVIGTFSTDKKTGGPMEASSRYPMALNIAGGHPTSPYTDSLSIVATSIETATDTGGSISWKELR